MDDVLRKQMEFLVEIDKLKSVFRQTSLLDGSRRENDAEHSWHLCMMAIVLAPHANGRVDLIKVCKMVLIHDLVEIDAGDTLLYHTDSNKRAREEAAANRIFGLLPPDQEAEFKALWMEFERRESMEARFASAIDRLEPIMQNYYTGASAWRRHGIQFDEIIERNRHISEGSVVLFEYARSLAEECLSMGLLDMGDGERSSNRGTEQED